MIIHTYIRYVCLFVVFLIVGSCMNLRGQTMWKQPTSEFTRKIRLRVIDGETNAPIDGAYISIGGEAFISSPDGYAALPQRLKPESKVAVQCLGYKTQVADLKALPHKGSVYIIRLIPEVKRLAEVVISSERQSATVNTVSNKLSSAAIDQSLGKSLASLLEQVSGVSSIQTGTTVAKPVIQGMHGNRILIINNGARQTGQQWGADHAPEVDMNNSGSIQVVKGADAVRYGSEALGGIIVMDQKTLPFRQKELKGKATSLYGSNGHRYAFVGQIESSLPFLRNIAWRVQGTYSNSGDRSTANYLLNNTGTREFNFSAGIGYDRERLRIESFYSRYDNRMGVMLSAQMGSEDLLAERIRLGRPVLVDPFTRSITYPRQRVVHETLIGKVKYDTGRWGELFWQGSWQKDKRTENRIRRMNHSHIPAIGLNLKSFQNFVRWNIGYGAWQTEAGGQFMLIDNYSQAGTGVVPVIPNYTETSWGAYAIQKFHRNLWDAEAGIREYYQETRATGYDWTGVAYGGSRKFRNLSYSLGTRYKISNQWSLTSNLGLAWRAPHVYELYSNGNELGSGMFVKGDSTMRSERSYKWITSVNYRTQKLNVRIDGYLQWIDNYIYDEPARKNITVISGSYPVFQYKQTPAFFRGADLDLRFVPLRSLEYRLITSIIWANEQSSGNYLPYIPPMRIDHQLTWTPAMRRSFAPHLTLKHRFTAKQTRFDPKTDLIDHTPPAYHLLGFEAGVEWSVGRKHKIRFLLAGDNMLNKEYKEYTNRSRYYAHDIGRDVRCSVQWSF